MILGLAACAPEPYVITAPSNGGAVRASLPRLALPRAVYTPSASPTPRLDAPAEARGVPTTNAVASRPAPPAQAAVPRAAVQPVLSEPPATPLGADRGRLGTQATWRLLTSGTALIEGDIGTGFAVDLERLMRSRGDIGTLVLRSGGGSLVESLLAGAMVRQHERSTAVLDVCASACIYLYAGGVERMAQPAARLGVHQVRLGGEDNRIEASTLQDALAWIQDYLMQMSISPNLLNISLTASSDTMLWLSPAQMTQTGLVTTWL